MKIEKQTQEDLNHSGYSFVAGVVARIAKEECLIAENDGFIFRLTKMGFTLVQIECSANEPKIHVSSGIFYQRVICDRKALKGTLDVLFNAKRQFWKDTAQYEL